MASLGNDLAQIRKEQNLSLEDINKTTKIPRHILVSIEDGSIFSDFEENSTYIRSYVRGYAKALSIDEHDILYALNNRERASYQGSLQELLDDADKKTFEFDEDQKDTTESDKDDQMVHDHAPELQSSKPEKKETSSRESSIPSQKSPTVGTVNWANMGRRFQPLKATKSKVWIGVAVIILIAAVGSYLYLYAFDSQNSSPQNSQPQQSSTAGMTSDSLQLNITPPAQEDSLQPATNGESADLSGESLNSLPDTLNVVLYAAYGKLEPVRVYTDIMDNINPYWIAEGEAMRFNFVNELRIRGDADRFVLLMNGHVIKNLPEHFYNPKTERLEINRSFFKEDDKWLQASPDSLAIDAPPPSEIKNHPTFN